MTRIFVYEYLSGGGDPAANDDLLPMGQSMRDAVVADLLRLDNCEVSVATSDLAKAPIRPAISVRPRDGETPFDFVARHAQASDLVWVVAPETDGVLARLAQRIEPARWLGCDSDSIALASSKHATLARLAEVGITTPLAFEHALDTVRWVVKPDDGAGSVDTRVHASCEAARLDRAQCASLAGNPPLTIEPWVEGEALSLSLLCHADHAELLSVNRQHISIDAHGAVAFHGVTVDTLALDARGDSRTATLRAVASRTCSAMAGLRGFVGIDLVWHAQRGPVVIEVNPRVTCAYVGLSQALGRNLAADVMAAQKKSVFPATWPAPDRKETHA